MDKPLTINRENIMEKKRENRFIINKNRHWRKQNLQAVTNNTEIIDDSLTNRRERYNKNDRPLMKGMTFLPMPINQIIYGMNYN